MLVRSAAIFGGLTEGSEDRSSTEVAGTDGGSLSHLLLSPALPMLCAFFELLNLNAVDALFVLSILITTAVGSLQGTTHARGCSGTSTASIRAAPLTRLRKEQPPSDLPA